MRKFPPSTPHATDSTAATARRFALEVEPLSEQRWAKIEQAVFARLDGADELASRTAPLRGVRQRAALWVAAAAFAAALALVIGVRFGPGPAEHAALSRISTGATPSHLALPGLALDVSPESAIVVSGGERESTLIVLDRGEVACDVAPRRPGAPLVVQAGEVRVEVVGTRFRVTRQGETARVAVQEGMVNVSSRGQTVAVGAGETWPKQQAEPQALELPREVPVAARDQVEEAAPRPRAPRSAPRVAPPEPGVEVEKERAPEPASEQQQFEAATRLERSEPARAIQLYGGLSGGGSSWAMNALFAHGRLEAARGNKAEARRILGEYLARFPQGGNAQDARMLLGRLK